MSPHADMPPGGGNGRGRRASRLVQSSTAHGPAMTTRRPGPIANPPVWTTLPSGLPSRLASLYGCRMGMTCSTAG